MIEREKLLSANDWALDTHSTILSRKHSFHKMVGRKRYVKVKREKQYANT